MEKKSLKETILNILIILIFIISALFMAKYHELWSDEAQSWLIARDLSFSEILGYISYEGTPPLWVFIIKIFMAFGITYDQYYIIPIIFMSLGLLFLYTKFDIPWYLKILFPFTFFVFYQTTIVVRSYSLILLGISLVYYYFPQRYKHPWKYYFSMLYFMNISLHTFFVAGGFYVVTLLFLYKDFKKLEKDVKKKMIILSVLLFITFLILFIILLPKADIGAGIHGKDFFYVIGETTFSDENRLVQIISTIAMVAITLYIVISKYKSIEDKNEAIKEFEKLIIVFPLILLYVLIHAQTRYFALLYFMIVLYFINSKELKIAKITLIIMFCIQIYWNIGSCIIDYNEKYSVGEDIAQFLRDIDYEHKTIDTINFHVVEISPYFEGNVFENSYHTDKAFYSWSINSGYDTVEDLLNSNADIYIIPLLSGESINGEAKVDYSVNVIDFLSDFNDDHYNAYSFVSALPQKNRIHEYDNFIIFVNEKVQSEMDSKNIVLEKETRKFNIYYEDKLYKIIDFSN